MVIGALAFWLGFKLGQWQVRDEIHHQEAEATRLLAHCFGMNPKPEEPLDQFQDRIRSYIQHMPGDTEWNQNKNKSLLN
jgi:hypothetical protein